MEFFNSITEGMLEIPNAHGHSDMTDGFDGEIQQFSNDDIYQFENAIEGTKVSSCISLLDCQEEILDYVGDKCIVNTFVHTNGMEIPYITFLDRPQSLSAVTVDNLVLIPSGPSLLKSKEGLTKIKSQELVKLVENLGIPIFFIEQIEPEIYKSNELVNKYSEECIESSRINMSIRLQYAVLFSKPSFCMNKFIEKGKFMLEEHLNKRRVESDEIKIEDIADLAAKYTSQDNKEFVLGSDDFKDILSKIDKAPEKRKFYLGDREFFSPIVYNNNPKRCWFVIPNIPFSDAERSRIITICKNIGMFPNEQNFAKVTKINSLGDPLVYKINNKGMKSKLGIALSSAEKPKIVVDNDQRLTCEESIRYKKALEDIYIKFDKCYRDTPWVKKTSVAVCMHEDNVKFNLDLFEKTRSECNLLNDYTPSVNPLSDYFGFFCITKTTMSNVFSNVYSEKQKKNHFRVEFVKIPTIDVDSNYSMIITSPYKLGDVKKCKILEVMVVNDDVKSLLTTQDYKLLTFENSIVQSMKPMFVKYDNNNWLYLRTYVVNDKEQQAAAKFTTLIPIISEERPNSISIEQVKMKLILQNITNRRVSEETYYWIRYMYMAPFRRICITKDMKKELVDKCSCEPYSMGTLVEIIKDNSLGNYDIAKSGYLIDISFPYCSPEPWNSGGGDGGLYDTIKFMLLNKKLGLKKDEMEHLIEKDPSSDSNYYLWNLAVEKYGILTPHQIERICNNDTVNVPIIKFGIEGSKVAPESIKIIDPVRALMQAPKIFGGDLFDSNGLSNRFSYMYMTNPLLTFEKKECNLNLYARMCGKEFPLTPCEDYQTTLISFKKSLPIKIKCKFRDATRLFLSIIGTPKIGERVKDTSRSIFVIPMMLFFALKQAENLFKIIIDKFEDQTILDSIPKKCSKIMSTYRELHRLNRAVSLGSWDEQKYHTTMSIMLMVGSAVKILEATIKSTDNRSIKISLNRIISNLYFCCCFFSEKRVLVPSLKMVKFKDGSRYFCDYLANPENCIQTQGNFMLTKCLSEQKPLDRKWLLIKAGNFGEGFFMGFNNNGGTMLRSLTNRLLGEVHDKIGLHMNLYHSSDDAMSISYVDRDTIQELFRRFKIGVDSVKLSIFTFNFIRIFGRVTVAHCKSSKKSAIGIEESLQCAEYNTIFFVTSANSDNLYKQEAKSRDVNYRPWTNGIDPETVIAVNEPMLTGKTVDPSLHLRCMDWMLYRYASDYGLLRGDSLKIYLMNRNNPELNYYMTNWQMPRRFPIGQFSMYNEMECLILSNYYSNDWERLETLSQICNPNHSYIIDETKRNVISQMEKIIPLKGFKFNGINSFETTECRVGKQQVVGAEDQVRLNLSKKLQDCLRSVNML